jgi:hypothetical protein
MFRRILNMLFPSMFVFPDRSRIDYLIREDCLRYMAAGRSREVVEIPLIYDTALKRSRMDTSIEWRWKSNGKLLTEQEKLNLLSKINQFMAKRPREFIT